MNRVSNVDGNEEASAQILLSYNIAWQREQYGEGAFDRQFFYQPTLSCLTI